MLDFWIAWVHTIVRGQEINQIKKRQEIKMTEIKKFFGITEKEYKFVGEKIELDIER